MYVAYLNTAHVIGTLIAETQEGPTNPLVILLVITDSWVGVKGQSVPRWTAQRWFLFSPSGRVDRQIRPVKPQTAVDTG